LITQYTIDKVLAAADIVEVVSEYVTLKRQGVNYKGCCPFHNEKTPSFVVSPVKQIYKCFGCGVAGGPLRFVMEQEKLSFPEAIRHLADKYNIEVEEDAVSQSPETIELKEAITQVNAFAAKKFREAIKDAPEDVKSYLAQRLTEEDIIEWGIGWAPDQRRYLTEAIVNSGKFEAANKCGIIHSSQGSNYDAFRSRIMFPIEDRAGTVIAFGGRIWPADYKKAAKYINSPENPAYNKSYVLYGLQLAAKGIQDAGFAILVEGYMDVIAMHRNGDTNTVGTCGTALTLEQAKLLRRYTEHVIVMRDGDSAGLKAIEKDIPQLLMAGIRVDVAMLPPGLDPDDYVNAAGSNVPLPELVDGILWLCRKILQGVMIDDHYQRGKALDDIIKILYMVPEAARGAYVKEIAKEHRYQEREINNRFKAIKREQHADELTEEDEALKKLSKEQRDEYLRYGFFTKKDGAKSGYYFNTNGGGFKAKTNFIITPLYHVYGNDNRRMVMIDNGIEDAVVEIPSKAMMSTDMLLPLFFNEGYFLPREGFTKDHLFRILIRIGKEFPRVWELNALGWQAEGFFAYQNKVFFPEGDGGQLLAYNEHGVVEIEKKCYLSPSKSRTQEKNREGDNLYENDLYLIYKSPAMKFEKWADLVCKVYDKAGWLAIAWSVGTLFRDIIIKTAPLPHLHAYGQKGSGKSMYGESIQALFFSGKDSDGNMYRPMNLNQGTDFAFFNRYERFSNCPNVLNEFDENAIKEEWFRAIKSSYDSEGREKGKGQKNRTTSQKIRCSTLIMGQYLGTKDDNSVLTRSLPVAFQVTQNREEHAVRWFRELKAAESQGLSGILTELLFMREEFRMHYSSKFHEIMMTFQGMLMARDERLTDRILKNISSMLTCIYFTGKRFQLPFTFDEFVEWAADYTVNLNGLANRTSGISEFWSYVEYLVDSGEIEAGYDFKIEPEQMDIKLKDETIQFMIPKKILYLRMNSVYLLYAKGYRQISGKMAIPKDTLELYMIDQPYWIGRKDGSRFKGEKTGRTANTSCIVLDMDQLPVNLERAVQQNEENPTELTTIVGWVHHAPTAAPVEGLYKFTLYVVTSKENPNGNHSTDERYIKCFTKDISILDYEVDSEIKVKGSLTSSTSKDRTFYKMDVTEVLEVKSDEGTGDSFFGDELNAPL
jgi:DNA primase